MIAREERIERLRARRQRHADKLRYWLEDRHGWMHDDRRLFMRWRTSDAVKAIRAIDGEIAALTAPSPFVRETILRMCRSIRGENTGPFFAAIVDAEEWCKR
jgi:hypothetical protein